MPKKKLIRIGQCIYCGTTQGKLTEEHIYPEGMGGEFTLDEASCLICNSITSKFELDVQRNLFAPIRSVLKLSKSKTYLQSYPLIIRKNGSEQLVHFDPSEIGTIVHFPHFESPAHLSGKPFEAGVMVNGWTTHILPSIETFKAKIKEKYDPDSIKFDATHRPYKPSEFSRFLAKLAYGFTVAKVGVDAFQECYVLPAILGKKNDIGRWVGCQADADEFSYGQDDWEIRLNIVNNSSMDMVAEIKLFGQLSTPTYLVVVGQPKPAVIE